MKKTLLIGFLILIFVLSGCSNSNITGGAIRETKGDIKEISIDAFKFGYSPDTITVNKGDTVRITINNLDTLHGLRIPELGISGKNTVEFTADKAGTFTWRCNSYCGSGHMGMSGKLIVTE